MSPLRLLMVSEPGVDGVFLMVDSIVRQIHRDHPEISVDLAYSSRRGGPALLSLVSAIEKRGDRTIDLRVGNAPAPSDLAALASLVRFARQRERQLVHAHSSKAGALARIARLLNLFPPVIYSPHAYFGMPRLGGPKETVFNLVESVLGHIGRTVNCSEDERDFAADVLRIPRTRLQVVHNGIDTGRFRPADAAAKARARRHLGLPEAGKILVTIGRDSAQKNYPPLYAVLDRLLPAGDWAFSHAGAGSLGLRSGLQPAASGRCHNFEHLEDVTPLLQSADGFVMTSRYEGLSLAMLSGLSCGLPSFLTDSPGFQFLRTLGFDEISWLPSTADRPALERSLEEALSAWAARPPAILQRQRDLVCSHFCSESQIAKLVSLYRP